jgi:pimeloyl-ACP methyl ester carboxylesterase
MIRPPEPFSISVSDAEIDDLHRRLRATRWSPEVENDDWRYGTNGDYLRDLIGYWSNAFDWRAREAEMNAIPQFRTVIDGVPIHFLHVRGKGSRPMPVVLTHGWPWTFWDWAAMIGPLTDPEAYGGDPDDSFDVIIPSLPGFIFSTPLTHTGVTVPVIASLWDRLLRDVLGYDRYGAAGGDWGAAVTIALGRSYADSLTGIYLSTPPILLAGGVDNLREDDYGPNETGWLQRTKLKWATTTSHVAVHTADPQTLAWALNDSPAGLASWLIERRRSWSDCQGDVEKAFSRDFLLTTTSLYWFTHTIGSSMRLYADSFRGGPVRSSEGSGRIDCAIGIGVFPEEVALLPRRVCERIGDLVHWSVLPRGGHFAPAEQPRIYTNELQTFFRPLRQSIPGSR